MPSGPEGYPTRWKSSSRSLIYFSSQGYDLSLNRYKEVVHEEVAHRPPREIFATLGKLEAAIQQGMKDLEGMLG